MDPTLAVGPLRWLAVDQREQQLFNQLLQNLDRIDPWLARMDPDQAGKPQIWPNSAMAGDNKKTDPYQTSHIVWHAISHAVDCLHMLRSVFRDASALHMYAPFLLIRGAMENSSAAVWMLAPGSRPERVLRRLRFAALDIHGGEKMKRLIGYVGPRSEQQRNDQVQDLARRAGVDERKALKRPSYTEIVAAAGAHTGVTEKNAQMVWGMCSAVAHGDFWSTPTVVGYEEIPGAPEGIKHLHVSADVQKLFLCVWYAVEMADAAWKLYDERSRSPY